MPGQDMPLLPRQIVWVVNTKTGIVAPIVGPDSLVSTGDDAFLMPDPQDPFKVVKVESEKEAIQDFITLRPDQYAVIHNPGDGSTIDYPNGPFAPGREKARAPELSLGKKRVVVQGCFPRWPEQKIEVRSIHRLSSNEFLVVEVEDENVDSDAPYFDLLVKCAQITTALVDETVASKDGGDVKKVEVTGSDDDSPEDTEDSDDGQEPPENSAPLTEDDSENSVPIFRVGQRIIIPGSLTPTFIPPSGTEVECEETESIEPKDDDSTITNPAEVVCGAIQTSVLRIENIDEVLEAAGFSSLVDQIRNDYSYFKDDQGLSYSEALWKAIQDNLNSSSLRNLAKAIGRMKTQDSISPNAEDAAVRKAVVLGPTEFCVLLDEDGRPNTKQGPGRVFPGPYDVFLETGSRGRVYDAYHLRRDRGILLRVVCEEITPEKLLEHLPNGTTLDEDQEEFFKGDEIFTGGFDAYLVPSHNVFEVINPTTRQPHVGNDHSNVYVHAIGVDQKSGVYVSSVETGDVQLVKGEKKLLLDPRRQEHAKRKVPGTMWNLIIGRGEPHKKVEPGAMVETPWALSVVVGNNEAALVTSKAGRRVVVGHCIELLEYEESLEVLTLSTGRPKKDDRLLETCFLRVTGNRLTDRVRLETADHVTIQVDLSFGVQFVGETDEERQRWFNHQNYVQLLCDHARSRLRAAARQRHFSGREGKPGLYATIPEFVRDTLLGEKPEEADQHRPGLSFEENGMLVDEVEVLGVSIPDEDVCEILEQTNTDMVTRELEDAAAEAALASDRKRDQIAAETADIVRRQTERDHETQRMKLKEVNTTSTEQHKLETALAEQKQKDEKALSEAREKAADAIAKLVRARENEDIQAKVGRDKQVHEAAVEFRQALADIKKALAQAGADADVKRLSAIQPGLVEALDGLGNKELMTALAENLPDAGGTLGFLLGTGGLEALKKMVQGTPLESALNALSDTPEQLDAQSEQEVEEPVIEEGSETS